MDTKILIFGDIKKGIGTFKKIYWKIQGKRTYNFILW